MFEIRHSHRFHTAGQNGRDDASIVERSGLTKGERSKPEASPCNHHHIHQLPVLMTSPLLLLLSPEDARQATAVAISVL